MKKLKIITVGGMTGVGKTTLVKKMSEELNKSGYKTRVMYEMFEDQRDSVETDRSLNDDLFDSLLSLFFENIKYLEHESKDIHTQALNRVLMHQNLFLTNRATKSFSSLSIAKEQDLDYLILDRTIFEDWIFSYTTMSNYPKHFKSYIQTWIHWADLLELKLSKYKVTHIILESDVDVVLGRIQKRGRDYEQGKENEKYFRNLHNAYTTQIDKAFTKAKIYDQVHIDTSFIDTEEVWEQVKKII